jgi:hypothetical protein
VNVFLNILQENGLSPACTLVCNSRFKRSVKPFLHTLHMKGSLRPRIISISLPLGVHDVKHVLQELIFLSYTHLYEAIDYL